MKSNIQIVYTCLYAQKLYCSPQPKYKCTQSQHATATCAGVYIVYSGDRDFEHA
jgi:hypothetical protein